VAVEGHDTILVVDVDVDVVKPMSDVVLSMDDDDDRAIIFSILIGVSPGGRTNRSPCSVSTMPIHPADSCQYCRRPPAPDLEFCISRAMFILIQVGIS
jgi:hypothetical protein